MTAARTFLDGSTPTVLLVHGAFTDASIWMDVIAGLQNAGIGVLAPANPLRGLATDAAYLASIVRAIDGPVLLTGHAYGGAVITQAGTGADNVVGLVYVAAFAPAAGERLLDLTARFPDTQLQPALRPATFPTGNTGSGVELYLTADRYRDVFAADLPARTSAAAAAAQRPVAAAAFGEPVTAAAWTTRPSWFVVATADRAIHPDAQRFMARRAGADTIEVDASHAVARSRPDEVTAHIRAAAAATRVSRIHPT
jgi:pimeloyl-ACP methyl ester carboxylesterase